MPTYADARARSTVILPDGRIATLIYIRPESNRAKVRLLRGGHLMIPAADLRAVVTHLEGAHGFTDCCQAPIDTLDGYLLTTVIDLVDCRG